MFEYNDALKPERKSIYFSFLFGGVYCNIFLKEKRIFVTAALLDDKKLYKIYKNLLIFFFYFFYCAIIYPFLAEK